MPPSREAVCATRGHSPENESNLRRALVNVASTLHVVQEKYCDISFSERHVSGDASFWGAFLLRVFAKARRRASLECMRENALFFMHARRSPRRFMRDKNFRIVKSIGAHGTHCET